LLAAALIAPPWTPIAALAAAIGAWIAFAGAPRRAATAITLAAGIVVAVVALLSVSAPDALTGGGSFRSVAGCVFPRSDLSADRLIGVAGAAGRALGPSVIALAGLGAFMMARGGVARFVSAIAGLTAACAMAGALRVEIACIPLVLAAWWLAAAGLQETIAAMRQGRLAHVGAVLILLLLPALQLARRTSEERDDHVRPSGHEHLSLQRMRGLLNMIPDDASVVREDATVDLLLRAAIAGGQRGAKRFVVVPREAETVERARSTGPVYAFPSAQLDLSHRGFVLQPVSAASRRRDRTFETIRGLSAIAGRRACHLMGSGWSDVSDVTAAGRLAVVAETSASFGPVVIFLGGAAPPTFVPEAWTPRMIRGFQWSVFDGRRSAGGGPLRGEAEALGVPAGHPLLSAPVLAKLSLHRIPRSPLALPVDLGGSFPIAIAKLDPTAVSERLSVCHTSAADVTPFAIGVPGVDPR
jgi:hypothetical protein